MSDHVLSCPCETSTVSIYGSRCLLFSASVSEGTIIVLSDVNTAVQTKVVENIKPSLIFIQLLQTSNDDVLGVGA